MPRILTACYLLLCTTLFLNIARADELGPVAVVQTMSYPQTRLYNAVIEAVHQSTVSAQTSGRITEINFDVQDYVKKGQVLMRFVDKEQKSRLDSARSSMKGLQASAEQTQKELDRVQNIYQKKLVAKSVLDKAQAENKTSQARLKAARAKVAEAQEQWEHTVVRAPYSGIVVERHVEVGETASSGQALMTGLSLDHLRAVVDLPQDASFQARANKQMFVLTPAGKKIKITADKITIFPYADPKSHSFRARLDLPSATADLYPGMLVKVGVEVGQTKHIMVPYTAVVQRSEVTAVYIVDAGGKVLLRHIRTGARHGEHVVVLTGLREGDNLLLDPYQAVAALKAQRSR